MVEKLLKGRIYQIDLDTIGVVLPFEVVGFSRNPSGETVAVLETPSRLPLLFATDDAPIQTRRFTVSDRWPENPTEQDRFKVVNLGALPDVSPSGNPLDTAGWEGIDRGAIAGELKRPG